MSTQTSLKDLERKLYHTSLQDGVLDIQIGCFLLIFAVTPFLGPYLGDFWSSMIFLPVWAAVLFGGRAFRKRHIQPRIGRIEFGSYRVKRLQKLNFIILGLNLVAVILGVVAFLLSDVFPAWIVLSVILLIGFSLGGYMLELPRFYLYGLLAGLAPHIGEYLYSSYGISHHGLPITFVVLSAILIVTGVVLTVQVFRRYSIPKQEELGW
jgi:hypothetical protein